MPMSQLLLFAVGLLTALSLAYSALAGGHLNADGECEVVRKLAVRCAVLVVRSVDFL